MTGELILCVDDEEFNLDILEERLTSAGFRVELAENGTEALECLANPDQTYSAVLLDRMMPDMDGLEVLKEAKTNASLDGLPIIMQTAKASQADIKEGLDAGAHYYLTKPFGKDELLSIVKTAVADFKRYQKMRQSVLEANSALKMLQTASFRFSSRDDVQLLAPVVANATSDADRVIIGLIELMTNAVEHGNLALTYDDKTNMLAEGTWDEEVLQRLSDQEYKDRFAEITFVRRPDAVELEIKDQGNGFEWEKYLEYDADRAFHSHGRGVMLAKEMSFDHLEYRGCGNHVVVRVNT